MIRTKRRTHNVTDVNNNNEGEVISLQVSKNKTIVSILKTSKVDKSKTSSAKKSVTFQCPDEPRVYSKRVRKVKTCDCCTNNDKKRSDITSGPSKSHLGNRLNTNRPHSQTRLKKENPQPNIHPSKAKSRLSSRQKLVKPKLDICSKTATPCVGISSNAIKQRLDICPVTAKPSSNIGPIHNRANKVQSYLDDHPNVIKPHTFSHSVVDTPCSIICPAIEIEQSNFDSAILLSKNNKLGKVPDWKQVESLRVLERVAREAYSYVVAGSGKEEVEDKIMKTEHIMRALTGGQTDPHPQEVKIDPLEPHLTSDDITRIKELFPPANYEPPTSERQDLQCIRGYSAETLAPDASTLRCMSNYGVHIDSSQGSTGHAYQITGDYLNDDKVSYLPVPSIWTPQHALMNTAPCISSPGIFKNNFVDAESHEESDYTDTDEETAIY